MRISSVLQIVVVLAVAACGGKEAPAGPSPMAAEAEDADIVISWPGGAKSVNAATPLTSGGYSVAITGLNMICYAYDIDIAEDAGPLGAGLDPRMLMNVLRGVDLPALAVGQVQGLDVGEKGRLMTALRVTAEAVATGLAAGQGFLARACPPQYARDGQSLATEWAAVRPDSQEVRSILQARSLSPLLAAYRASDGDGADTAQLREVVEAVIVAADTVGMSLMQIERALAASTHREDAYISPEGNALEIVISSRALVPGAFAAEPVRVEVPAEPNPRWFVSAGIMMSEIDMRSFERNNVFRRASGDTTFPVTDTTFSTFVRSEAGPLSFVSPAVMVSVRTDLPWIRDFVSTALTLGLLGRNVNDVTTTEPFLGLSLLFGRGVLTVGGHYGRHEVLNLPGYDESDPRPIPPEVTDDAAIDVEWALKGALGFSIRL